MNTTHATGAQEKNNKNTTKNRSPGPVMSNADARRYESIGRRLMAMYANPNKRSAWARSVRNPAATNPNTALAFMNGFSGGYMSISNALNALPLTELHELATKLGVSRAGNRSDVTRRLENAVRKRRNAIPLATLHEMANKVGVSRAGTRNVVMRRVEREVQRVRKARLAFLLMLNTMKSVELRAYTMSKIVYALMRDPDLGALWPLPELILDFAEFSGVSTNGKSHDEVLDDVIIPVLLETRASFLHADTMTLKKPWSEMSQNSLQDAFLKKIPKVVAAYVKRVKQKRLASLRQQTRRRSPTPTQNNNGTAEKRQRR